MKTRKLTATMTALVASFVLFGVAIFTSCGSKDEPINPKVKPNYISLNRSNLSLKVGESYQLIATVEPENADDKSVIWTVDGSAATINDEGVVVALPQGSAVVTATANANHDVFVDCYVTVSGSTPPEPPVSDDPEPTLPGPMWGTIINNP